MVHRESADLFWLGLSHLALVVGGSLLILQAIVIGTHFCVLSWVYEGVARMLGEGMNMVSAEAARELLAEGAAVIDVRTVEEFSEGHIPTAVNLPVETLRDQLQLLPDGPWLLHCKSGMRSDLAVRLLRKEGYDQSFNLGGYERALQIVNPRDGSE